jgi:hypothetical protein
MCRAPAVLQHRIYNNQGTLPGSTRRSFFTAAGGFAMLFTHWFRRTPRPTRSFRPTVQLLEDRTVPNATFEKFHLIAPPPAASDPATHLMVFTPANVQAGQEFDVVVAAEDASNHVARGYTGTVQLSLGTADAGAKVPASYTFTARDHGVHEFDVTLAATGSQTVTATDTTTSSITGSSTLTVNPAPVATHLMVITQHATTVGSPSFVAVVALDASNHLVSNYTGTVHFTSSDGSATLPADYPFTAADHGRHIFSVTFQTAGSQTVTATDTKTATITGQGTVRVDTVGAVTHLGVFVRGPAAPNTPTAVVVVALDANNHVVPTYTGTVSFTSSDSGATLPTNYTFQASDHGIHLFSVTFVATGPQTVTVTDTATSSITGTVTARVRAETDKWFDFFFREGF